MGEIKLLIADDNVDIRTYFESVLDRETDIHVVGGCGKRKTGY